MHFVISLIICTSINYLEQKPVKITGSYIVVFERVYYNTRHFVIFFYPIQGWPGYVTGYIPI